MAMEGAWTTTNASSNNNNKTSLGGWGAGGDYWDNAVTLVDGFSLQGCESSIATTRLLAESENDFGHFRLETCVPFLASPPPEAPRSRLPVRAPGPPQVRPPVPPKPAAPSPNFVSSKQTIPVKPSIPAKPSIAPKPSHLAGKLKTVGGGFSTTIKVEGERSVVLPPRSQATPNDSNVTKPHFERSADSRSSALIDNAPCESGTKKGDNATGFCESGVVSANHCIGRGGESESRGSFEPSEEGGAANDKSGEGGGCDAANGDSLKADTGRSNSAVGDRDMNCRALIEKFNTINQSTKSSDSSAAAKAGSDEADELKSKSKDRCNGSSVSETSSVSGVWRVVSSTHQPRQPQTPNDEIEMSNKKKKGCLGIIDSDDGSFALLTSTSTSANLMQPEVVESEWRHISSLATQYEFGEESLTSLSSSSSSRIPVRTRKESVFDKAESRRRESEVWRKDSGISLTSGCSSPARRLSYPDRSVTPSGSRSYLERTSTPVGSRSSTPSLLTMRSSTPSLTTMRSSTPCLLPRPITPSCGRSSTPSLPSCRSTTPSLPSLLPRPTTPSTVGGRPTTPSLGSLLPRPTTPSRSLSARRGSLSLPLRSSEAQFHCRSSRPSLPSFSPIPSRSSRPPPSLTLSSSSMGVVGEPSLARRWDSTPSLEVSSSHPFHPRFPLPCSGRAGEPMNPKFCPDFLLWYPACHLDYFSCLLLNNLVWFKGFPFCPKGFTVSVMHQTMGPVSCDELNGVCNLDDNKGDWDAVADKDEDEDDKSTGCPGQAWGRPNGVAIPSSNLCTGEHTCYKHASDYFHLQASWSTLRYLQVLPSSTLSTLKLNCFFQVVISVPQVSTSRKYFKIAISACQAYVLQACMSFQ